MANNSGGSNLLLWGALLVGGYILYQRGTLNPLLEKLKGSIPNIPIPTPQIPGPGTSPTPTTPTPLPPGSGGPNDKFGVLKIYADGPGSNWYMPPDPKNDPGRGNPELSGSPPKFGSKQPDGSWQMFSPGSIRWAISADDGFDQSKLCTCTNIVKPRGYMQTPKDWKNIEMTAFYKPIKCGGGSANGSCHIEHVMRGQRSTNETTNTSCGCSISCSDNYHCNIYPNEGRLKIEKNLNHAGGGGGYNSPFSGESVKPISPFVGKWIGFKTITYNKPDGSVQVELYVDQSGTGKDFKKMHQLNDHGQLKSRGSEGNCKHTPGNPVTWGGPLCAFRADNLDEYHIKWASIRSITPPSAVAAQASILGFIEDDYINLGQIRAYQGYP